MTLIKKPLFHLFIVCLTISGYNNLSAWENLDDITILSIDPDHIEIGAFFKGTQVLVNAQIPECDGVVVELEGKAQEMVLNKKGQRAFLWLNVSKIVVKNAPLVYILASSDKLDKICSALELEKELLGYVSLKRNIIFESDIPLTGMEFDEFIKLKEHRGFYNIDNKILFDPISKGIQKVTAILNIPPFIMADNYEIFLYCFKNGNLIKKTSANILIEEVGLTLLIRKLAFEKPAIYGLFAIIIALGAGIIIGLIFSKRSDRGH